MAEHDKDYFGTGSIDRAGKGVFTHLEEVRGFDVAAGLKLKPVQGGDNLMLSFVYMEPNSVAPEHAHDEEQMGTIIEGEYEFEINGERHICRKGDVYYIPPNVPHAARTFDQGCVALDVFTPPRAAFLKLAEE